MSVYAGPSDWWTDNTDAGKTHIATKGIVQSGLVLNLDAAVLSSYPGSGTTWNDLSGRGNSGVLTNGPTYSSTNGGAFILDGINDYILANSTSLNSAFSTSSVSHFVWAYPTSAGQIVVELGTTTINSSWHDTNIEISSAGLISMSTWHGSLTNKVTATRSFNNWYHLGFSYNGTTLTGYINGVTVGTTNFTRSAPYLSGQQTYYALGPNDSTNMGTFGYFGGKISSFVVYNRALSAAEVQQNFNATRSRYGI